MSDSFKKGDQVVTVLRGAGVTTREPAGTILYVKGGVAYVDNGPGNDPTPYDAVTGEWIGEDFFGFSRRIELGVGEEGAA